MLAFDLTFSNLSLKFIPMCASSSWQQKGNTLLLSALYVDSHSADYPLFQALPFLTISFAPSDLSSVNGS